MKTKLRIITYNVLRFLPLAILVLAVVLGCVLPFVVHDRHQVVTVYADSPEHLPSKSGERWAPNAVRGFTGQIVPGGSINVDSSLLEVGTFGAYVPVAYVAASSVPPYPSFWGVSGSISKSDSVSIYSSLASFAGISYTVSDVLGLSSSFFGAYNASSSAIQDSATSWCIRSSTIDYFSSIYPYNLAIGSNLSFRADSKGPFGGTLSVTQRLMVFQFDPSIFSSTFNYTDTFNITAYAVDSLGTVSDGVLPFLYASGMFIDESSMPSGYYLFRGSISSCGFTRPSFVNPVCTDLSVSHPFYTVLTSSSFYNVSKSQYVYPYPILDNGPDPDPPTEIPGYESGYQDGYKTGYDTGYSQGYNKGQTEQLTNPANFFLQPAIAFMQTDLFGSFSLGDAFQVVMFVLVAIIFIKLFAGG